MDKLTAQDHYRNIRTILIIVLALNWGVALVKIIYGLLTRCASITADGFHSLSDGASNLIGLAGIHFACQPIDRDHPYGHRKYETFFSLGIAGLLFLLAVGLIHESMDRLRNPVTPFIDSVSFLIMSATMIINFLVMRYEKNKGELLKSDILISDSLHTKADIFISFSVIIALAVIKLGFPILDPIATILIAIFIAHSGYEIIRNSSRVLCDTAAIEDLKKIADTVLSIKGVKTCHKIRTRGRPDDIHVDLHAQVKRDMHVDEAHKISFAIEEALKKNIPDITDVVVHIEPKD